MLEARVVPALLIPSALENTPDVSGASYFVAAWGPDVLALESAALEPIHMDVFAARLSQARAPATDSRTSFQLASLRAIESRMRQLASQWVAPAISSMALEPIDEVAASRAVLLADALARENTWLRLRLESLLDSSNSEPSTYAASLEAHAAKGEQRSSALAEKPSPTVDLVPRDDYLRTTVRLAHAESAQRQLLGELSDVRSLCNELITELESLRRSTPVPIPAPINSLRDKMADLQARNKSLGQAVSELESLRLPAARYYRLRELIPQPARRIAVRLARAIRGF
jgi:hypothetical protein